MRYELLVDEVVRAVKLEWPWQHIVEYRRDPRQKIARHESLLGKCKLPPIIDRTDVSSLGMWYPDLRVVAVAADRLSDENYYGVLYRELIHSTAHVFGRRAAMEDNMWESESSRCEEELVAELGSMMLRQEAGGTFCGFSYSMSFLTWYLEIGRLPPEALLRAGRKSAAAVNYLLQRSI